MLKRQKWNIFFSILITLTLIIGVISAQPSGKIDYSSTYVLNTENIMDHQWSPDGTQIAYAKCPTGQSWNCELWVSDFKFTNPVLIYTGIQSNGIFDWYGEWLLIGLWPVNPAVLNPDGTAISGELWKIRTDGTELTRLTSTETNGIKWNHWNHYWDGRGSVAWGKFVRGSHQVYFIAHDGNGWWGPHLTTDDGTDLWQRIQPYSYAFTSGYTPVCDNLLWGHASSGYQGPTTLYSSNSDGSNGHIIHSFNVKTWPMLLSDCHTILLSWAEGNIHAIDIDGTNYRIVLEDEFNNVFVSDPPNSAGENHPLEGQAFAMTSNRADDGYSHLFKVYASGDGIHQLTTGDYNDYDPDYSPDGKYLLYRRLPVDYDQNSGLGAPYELVVLDLVPTEFNALKAMINDLYESHDLNKGQSNSLLNKLDHSLIMYMKENWKTSTNLLHAFTNQINDFILNSILSQSSAEILIYHANIISEMIN